MRIGIVGTGLIGQRRAATAAEAGHEIIAVADLDATRAAAVAAQLGARALPDWRAVVAAELDIVVVATSHDSLALVALAAVEAGKHVLVEKPAGRSAREVLPILTAARARGRCVKVGFNHRFHPAMLKARELATAGNLGPLMFVRGRYGHGGRVGYETEWRCRPEISGGGEAIDQGCHLIDLSRWFLGDLRLAYGAVPTYFWPVPVDDNCFLALVGARGEMAWLHAGWTEWKNLFSFEIIGRDGKVAIEGLGGSYGVERLTYYRMLPGMGPPETTCWEYPFPDRSWSREFEEFVSAIQAGREPNGNIADAVAALGIVDQLYGRDNE